MSQYEGVCIGGSNEGEHHIHAGPRLRLVVKSSAPVPLPSALMDMKVEIYRHEVLIWNSRGEKQEYGLWLHESLKIDDVIPHLLSQLRMHRL